MFTRRVLLALMVVGFALAAVSRAWAEQYSYTVHFAGPEKVNGDIKLMAAVHPPISDRDADWKTFQDRLGLKLTNTGLAPYQPWRTSEVSFHDAAEKPEWLQLSWSVEKDGELRSAEQKIKLPPNGSTIVVQYDILYDQAPDIGTGVIPALPRYLGAVATGVVIDKRLKHKEVKESAPFRVPRGVVERKREEYTVTHSVGVQEGAKVEAEVHAHWAIIGASIKGAIELATHTTYAESKTTSREVEIQGGGQPITLVWVETYRTGRAVTLNYKPPYKLFDTWITDDVDTYTTPFEFREGWELLAKAVEE